MQWGPPLPDQVGPPSVMRALLDQAIAASPDNAALHAKRAFLLLDAKDFAAAAAAFETAHRLGECEARSGTLLARCYIHLNRPQQALDAVASIDGALFERGRALLELGQREAAEREFRAVLDNDPDDIGACRLLCRLLRQRDAHGEIVALCESLLARGATNAQLLYNMGAALALVGDDERALRLLFDPDQIASIEAAPMAGFVSLAQFNRALGEAILANPHQLTSFPTEDEANRGSRRVDDLFSGTEPQLFTALLAFFQQAVDSYVPTRRPGFDPWPDARPRRARLRPWGLIQYNDEYEASHIHVSGWLSGVYYVRVPAAVQEANGPGCIRFGPPRSVAAARPGLAPIQCFVPREGLLLLAPSHFEHGTIPSGLDEPRISVAFDVVPVG